MLTNTRFHQIFQTNIPVILAPMAGAADCEMAIAVAQAGALGSIACAMLSEAKIRSEVQFFRQACPGSSLNLNFFCHIPEPLTNAQEEIWKKTLSPYYQEFGVDPHQDASYPERQPFDENSCRLMEELKPEIVSFHFGLPNSEFVKRLKKVGCKILSSATTVKEALWLEAHGCDAVIAQGFEAGGHRAMFLTTDLNTQTGTMALVPSIVDRIKIPVIASGGIGDARGIAAAFSLGAIGVQIGSAYLLTTEAKISPAHKAALSSSSGENTAITNLFSGKPARGILNRLMKELGPISQDAPPFPFAGKALAPLKTVSGSGDFTSLWCGQGIALSPRGLSATDLTNLLYREAKALLKINSIGL